MKKLTLTLAVISALVLTACSSGEDSQQTAETTAATAAATTTKDPDEPDCGLHEENCYFTYNSLMKAIYEEYPDVYEHPLPDIVYEWDFSLGQIDEYYYGMGRAYILDYDDTANNAHIRLTVLFDAVYTDIDEFIQQLPKAYSNYEFINVNERYAYAHSESGGFTTAMGITGDRNIAYKLAVKIDGKHTDSTDILDEYKNLLEL